MQKVDTDETGFTLVELMVVVLVLAILIAAAVPQFMGARTRSQDGAAKANLRTVVQTAAAYAAGAGGTYPSSAQLAADEKALTFVAASSPSSDPKTISVTTDGSTFTATALSPSGTCHKVTTTSGSTPVWTTIAAPCQAAAELTVTTVASLSAIYQDTIGLVVDAAGNAYQPDDVAQVIYKITPAGVVSTFAGSGSAGSADGLGTAASFNGPGGIGIDSAGNLYVADMYNAAIRKITPAGLVSTYAAASGATVYVDPTLIGDIISLTVDSADNVYFGTAKRVVKITPGGVVSTLAGGATQGFANSATGSLARFRVVQSLAADASGNIYVADFWNYRIRKIAPDGAVTTLAGSGAHASTDGTGTGAAVDRPMSIAVDAAGTVWFKEPGCSLRSIDSGAVVTSHGADPIVTGFGSECAISDGTIDTAGYGDIAVVAAGPGGSIYLGGLSLRRVA